MNHQRWLMKLTDIGKYLGVSKQRAHQIAAEPGFPAQVAEGARGRLWDRRDVERWAKRWRADRPWR